MINNRWNAEIEADYKCTSISNKKIICLIYFLEILCYCSLHKKMRKSHGEKNRGYHPAFFACICFGSRYISKNQIGIYPKDWFCKCQHVW